MSYVAWYGMSETLNIMLHMVVKLVSYLPSCQPNGFKGYPGRFDTNIQNMSPYTVRVFVRLFVVIHTLHPTK